MRSKYGARKTVVDGITFDSKKEATRYRELKLLEDAGEIEKLKMQVAFELVPALYERPTERYTKGARKGQWKKGKCIERAVTYYADFVYYDLNKDKWIAEDVKGMRTKEYIIKRKLFRHLYYTYEFLEV